MGLKVIPTTTPETTLKEPKAGKGIRNQFWSTGFIKNDEQTPKRPESTVSRQFLPKKKHGISEREDLKQPFPYTPFKSGTLTKKTLMNVLHDANLNTQLNDDLSQIYGTQQQSAFPGYPRTVSSMQGTLRAHHNNGLYATSAIPRPESKGIWSGSQSGIIPPPPSGPYRPASAMNMPTLSRPASRANSDLGIGAVSFCDNIGNVPSRYQSYCTLPRPEQIDFDQHSNYGNEISQMAKQINQLYGPHTSQIQPSISPTLTNKQTILPSSRPASSMLVGAPGMAMVIFGCGVLRIIWNLKWAMGIEIVLAVLIFMAGVTGICASSRRSYSAATATFILSMLNSILSVIPFALGVLPAIANAFPALNPEWLFDMYESWAIDYLLSFICFAEIVITVISSIYGCRAFGLTMRLVEKLRFSVDLNTVFEGLSPANQKELHGIDNKEAI
ncbi:unnamed protein product [Acanthocheilonema viteae]|uniref:Uncharacterized protein n=1 Tax=Acanthocheilonema viteae TaxID=6277 RepID=A0A498SF64_ACAVI|nr:unnamed protein product [Acanthocheilonema viteae]